MESDSLPYLLAVDSASAGGEEAPAQSLKAVITALSSELGVGEVFEMPNEEVRGVADYEFFQVRAPPRAHQRRLPPVSPSSPRRSQPPHPVHPICHPVQPPSSPPRATIRAHTALRRHPSCPHVTSVLPRSARRPEQTPRARPSQGSSSQPRQ